MRLSVPFALIVCLIGSIFGQTGTGSITGTVKDPSGAVVLNAGVTISNKATGLARTTSTNQSGVFVFPELEPATYTLSVHASGFKNLEQQNIILGTGAKINVGDIVLPVGGLTETVTVQADAGQLQLQSESGERSDLITNRQIKDIAINGRNILDLTKVVPGILNTNQNAQSSVNNAAGTFNVNGTRSNMHEVSVDGATNINTGNNTGLLVTINPDAVAELKVLTSNYQAEYGRAGGGFVQTAVKSGTNEFHGGARYFRRHDSLNANSFFNNAQNRPRNIYRYNSYGYNFGGPVPVLGQQGKRKLFFFWSQEFYRQVIPQTANNIRVPSLLERQGDFSQTVDPSGARVFIRDPLRTGNCSATDSTACFLGNKIAADRWYSPGQQILSLYPQPNVTGRNDYNYTSQVSSQYPRREEIARVDYNLTDNTRFNVRFIRNADEQLLSYGTTTASWNWPFSVVSRKNGPGYTLGFTVTHHFSPTLINEFNYAPSLGAVTIAPTTNSPTTATTGINIPLLYPETNKAGYIPNLTYGGISGQTFPTSAFNGSPFSQEFRIHNLMDNVTKVAGRHVLKSGFYLQRSHNKRTSFTNIQGTVNFSNDANNPLNTGHPYSNALLGIYTTYDQASAQLKNDFIYNDVEAFLQDTWKITHNLTLDCGLRVSRYAPLSDKERQLSVFNPTLYDASKAVRIYFPVCLNNAAPCSGSAKRAVDPAQLASGFVPSDANTQPGTFIGLIVPNSGSLINGIGQAAKGYPRGGFTSPSLIFAPRFGFAYNIRGNSRTVVRGGFGIAYDRIRGDVTIDAILNPPNIIDPTLFYGRLGDIPSLRGSGFQAPPSVIGLDRTGNLPTVYTYSLGVQRVLGWGTTLDVSYVGTQGRHLASAKNLNQVPYGATFARGGQDPTQFTGGVVPATQPALPLAYSQAGVSFSGQSALPINFLRPYQGFGDVNYRSFGATSNYNSLQVGINRRFSQALTFGVAYTYSKTLTTANDETADFTHPYNTRSYDYKLANFDRAHSLVANYVYYLPHFASHLGRNRIVRAAVDNWQISGISQWVTGTPVELALSITGVDAGQRLVGAYSGGSNLLALQPRFYLKGDPAVGTNGMHIDPNAFIIPGVNNRGPYSRTYLRNPGWINHDVSLFKNFPVANEGKWYLQLRLEAFNFLNHAEFSGFNTATNLAVPTGSDAAGNQTFLTGTAIFNNSATGGSNLSKAIISNNIRGQRAGDKTKPLGTFFGEHNSTREPRVLELTAKFYF